MVLRSFSDIVSGLKQMLEPQRLAHFRARAGALNNRAVHEISDLLETLSAARSSPAPNGWAASRAPTRFSRLGVRVRTDPFRLA